MSLLSGISPRDYLQLSKFSPQHIRACYPYARRFEAVRSSVSNCILKMLIHGMNPNQNDKQGTDHGFLLELISYHN